MLAFSGMPLALQDWVTAGGFGFYALLLWALVARLRSLQAGVAARQEVAAQ